VSQNKKKILMLASVASTIEQFNQDNIRLLQSLGYDVDVACNFIKGNNISDSAVEEFKRLLTEINVGFYHIDFDRNALNIKQDIVAVRQVVKLVRENGYYAIHCHTPIGGVAGRIAARKAGIKVIYTAHGFHFFKGAPKLNWMLFYPVEKYLSRYTDMLVTINGEDFERAKEKFHAKDYSLIHGVGVDTKAFASGEEKNDIFTILSVGELNDNKNHSTVIKALSQIRDKEWQYLICGQGKKLDYLNELADSMGIGDRVHLLGYRNDVKEICGKADLFVFPSIREGLSVAMMEAMSAGLPVVASEIRGNTDLIINNHGGLLVPAMDNDAFSKAIEKLIEDDNLRASMGAFNMEYIKNYDIHSVHEEMKEIYCKVLKG